MKIIDFHTHVYPDKIAQKATQAIGGFYDLNLSRVGSLDNLLKHNEKAGVTHSVIHSVATNPTQVSHINDFIAQSVSKHPTRLSGFGTMHPDFEDKIPEIERCIAMGIKGLKLHPDTQEFNLDDKRMLELYDYLQGKVPILFHCGDYRYDYSHPSKLAKICRMFPRLQVIGAHFGGWSLWDEAVKYLSSIDCMLDTSSCSSFVGHNKFESLIKTFGADRLLFGTDFPLWDTEEELTRFMAVRMSDTDREKILYSNGAEILGLTD